MFFRAGVVNVTIWFGEMSDNNQIEFYRYMENIYPTALNENINITNVLILCNGKQFNLLSRKVCTKKCLFKNYFLLKPVKVIQLYN